ncbi:MAG: hypothetical protein DRG83_16935 [Deltaproteobacteria bacterium]|nr:MAG: hypothetical protein DRG83_16935 [Deltaproteobacteria bacterium]
MKFDFLFIIMTPGVEVERYFKVASCIQDKGYSVTFLCDTAFIKRRLLSKGAEYVFAKHEFFPASIDESEVYYLEKQYDLPSLRALYLPELRYLQIKDNQHRMVRITAAHLEAAERFLDKHSVGCIVAHQGANLLVRSFYYVSKKRGLPFIFVGFSPIKGKVALYFNEYAHWESLDTALEETFFEQELRETEEYIERVKQRRQTHIFPKKSWTEYLREKIWIFKLTLQQTFLQDTSNFSLPNSYTIGVRVRNYMSKLLRRLITRFSRWYFYDRFDPDNDQYFFFPLHFPAESQLTVRARPYANQEFLIEYIARSLPQGYKLYVKEHPNVLGSFSLSMLRRIKKISNVALINPTVNPHDLIVHSKAVVTINSTAGFEALMYFKPVIVFGQVFYRGYGVTIDVDSLYDLEWVIKKALESKVPKEKIIRFITTVRKASYDGCLKDPERLAESIVKKWSRKC